MTTVLGSEGTLPTSGVVSKSASTCTEFVAIPGRIADGGVSLVAPTDAPHIQQWAVKFSAPDLELDAYLGSYTMEAGSQDALVAIERNDGLVLAVADGVTPTPETPRVTAADVGAAGDDPEWADGFDGAEFAARRALQEVLADAGETPPQHVLRRANTAIREETAALRHGLRPRDLPQAAVALARAERNPLDGSWILRLARAADCDVWVRGQCDHSHIRTAKHFSGGWMRITDWPMLLAATRKAIWDWDQASRDATCEQRLERERQLGLDERTKWHTTALGRFQHVSLQATTVRGNFTDIVVATDGARLPWCDWERCDPDEWVTVLREWELKHMPPNRQHSDVGMLWLRFGDR